MSMCHVLSSRFYIAFYAMTMGTVPRSKYHMDIKRDVPRMKHVLYVFDVCYVKENKLIAVNVHVEGTS